MVPGVILVSSHALMDIVSLSGGNVTMTMIVVMAVMSWKVCVLSILVSQQLSPVAMGDAYPIITAAITTMTAEITVMSLAACSEPVTPTRNLLAIMEGVYPFSMSAME